MNHPITRDEAAWLVLRTIGLIFVWMTLTKVAGFAYTTHILTSDGLTMVKEALGGYFTWELALPQICMSVTYGALAYYFLRRGESCHRLLCSGARPRHEPTDLESDENDW